MLSDLSLVVFDRTVASSHSLAHAYQAVVGSDHQKAVIRLTAEHAEHSSAQILLVACQVSEADDFGLLELTSARTEDIC